MSRVLALVLCLALGACKLANVLPGGDAPQRAIQGGVGQILALRNDFEQYLSLLRQYEAAQQREDAKSAERLRGALAIVLDEAGKSRATYNQLVRNTAKEFTADTLKLALDAVLARYEQDEARRLVPPAKSFVEHVLAYQAQGSAVDFEKWHAELLQ